MSAPGARAQEQLADSCDIPAQGFTDTPSYVAQLIGAVTAAGYITRAEIEINKPPGTDEDYVFEIRAAEPVHYMPTSTVLATTTVPSASVPTGASLLSASFDKVVELTSTPVWLDIHRAGDLSVGFHFETFCGQGPAFLGNDPSAADWGNFSDDVGDLHFNVYVIPPCMGKAATIVGTPRKDVRKGTSGRDVMVGLGGDDRLSGLAGNDLICGGAGDDTVNGGPGRDTLVGHKGNDTLKGGSGRDTLLGHRGNDNLSGGSGEDRLKGGPGKDKQVQ